MPIQGPLRELGIHDVFQLLDLSRKTGVLRVSSELRQNEGTIWFEKGAVVAAEVRSNPHRLGDVLLRAGKIGEADLVRAARMQKTGDARRLGEILVDLGAVSVRELERQVRQQVEEVVFSLLGWAEGYFIFEEGATTPARESGVRISIEALLMEGARRIDEWARIQTRVPHLGIVPVLARDDESAHGTLTLKPFEWRVLSACDGHFDVREMARSLGASEFDVARTLFGLESAGVVAFRDPARPEPSAPRVDPDGLLRQGEEHLRRGDAVAAQTCADRLRAGHPDDPRGPLLLARSLLAGGRVEEAETALEDVIRLSPDHPAALRLLGATRIGRGRLTDGLEVWERWLALGSRTPDEDRYRAVVDKTAEALRGVVEGLEEIR